LKEKLEIVQDSREKKSLFKSATIKALRTGDYSLLNLENEISIERKSLIDLVNSLVQNRKRFKKELERNRELKYFAIIIEGHYTDLIHDRYKGSSYTKVKGETISKILCTLHIKYGVNFFFTCDRNGSKKLIKHLFESYLKFICDQL